MTHFLIIDETQVDQALPLASRAGYKIREAARAVVIDPQGAVALLHVARDGYYKLPGGGVDAGETPEIPWLANFSKKSAAPPQSHTA